MAEKRVQFNTVVQNQLPAYVRDEFPLVSEFLKQYYIAQEFQGASVDLIQNIDKYVKVQEITNLNETVILNEFIDFDDTNCTKCPDKCIVSRMCPEKLYNFSDKKTPKLVEDYWKLCTLCNSCQQVCPEGAIKVSWKENTYIFSIESDGVLPFNILIEKVFEIFLDKIDEFTERLGDIEIEL